MFTGCSRLSAVEVAISSWQDNLFATDNWLVDVAASGQFLCPPALGDSSTITRGASYCPAGWTVVPRVEVPVQWIKSDGQSYIELPDLCGYTGTTIANISTTISVDMTLIRGNIQQDVAAISYYTGAIRVQTSTYSTYSVVVGTTMPTANTGRILSS